MSNEWIDLLLITARDLQVLIVLLFFIGMVLFIASIAEIPLLVTTIKIPPENRQIARRSGIAIAILFGLILVTLSIYPKGVEVYGTVKYDDGTPVINADMILGPVSMKTDANGAFRFFNISRNENQILIKIKGKYAQNYILNMPKIYWELEQPIIMDRIRMQVDGEVMDENETPVGGCWANLSGAEEASVITNSQGKFHFGEIKLPLVLSRPLTLSIYLPKEQKPRFRLNLEIPTELSYNHTCDNYSTILLPSKDYVDVSGRVLLLENYTDRIPDEMPYVRVMIGGRTSQTDKDGRYKILKVPIKSTNYTIKSADGKELCNYNIDPLLTDSPEIPRNRDLIVFKSDLINVTAHR